MFVWCSTTQVDAIKLWAKRNKIIINASKTKEIVFHRPNPRVIVDKPVIEMIKETELLAVIFSDSFHVDTHVNYILKICSQHSYIMRMLRDQGITANQLNIVFDAIILSRITYVVCAWPGFYLLNSLAVLMLRFDVCLNMNFVNVFQHSVNYLETMIAHSSNLC